MSFRRGSFEEIQQESPFSRHVQRNRETLLRAWNEKGQAGFAQAWDRVFPIGWEAAREPQDPIRIVGETGDWQERALEVMGAPDQHTRVADEWWYLYHTFESNWTPDMHFTTAPNEDGAQFGERHARHDEPGNNRIQSPFLLGFLVALTGIEHANQRVWLCQFGLSRVVSVLVVPGDPAKCRHGRLWWSPGGHRDCFPAILFFPADRYAVPSALSFHG
jgi:hypothetical protein